MLKQASIQILPPSQEKSLLPRIPLRVLITTSTGSVLSYTSSSPNHPEWLREEGLASVQQAVFVPLPAVEVLVGSHARPGGETFFQRLQRQVKAAKGLPAYIEAFVRRFISGKYDVNLAVPPTATQNGGNPDGTSPLASDPFGFEQVLVVATSYGKIHGISTISGKVLWTRRLGLGWANEIGGTTRPLLMSLFGATEGHTSEVVLVGKRRATNVRAHS